MGRLMLFLFAVIATSLMGSAIVIVLTMGLTTKQPIMMAAAAGLALSIPVCWFVARQILKNSPQR